VIAPGLGVNSRGSPSGRIGGRAGGVGAGAGGRNPPGEVSEEASRERRREVAAFFALDFLVTAAFFAAVERLVALAFLVAAPFLVAVERLVDVDFRLVDFLLAAFFALDFLVAAPFFAAVERLVDVDFLDDFFAGAMIAPSREVTCHPLSLPSERSSNLPTLSEAVHESRR